MPYTDAQGRPEWVAAPWVKQAMQLQAADLTPVTAEPDQERPGTTETDDHPSETPPAA